MYVKIIHRELWYFCSWTVIWNISLLLTTVLEVLNKWSIVFLSILLFHGLSVCLWTFDSRLTVTKSEIVIFTVPYFWNDPLSFQVSSDKLRARVASLDLRGLKVYNIFNGTTMVGAVEKILKIMLSRLFQTPILE